MKSQFSKQWKSSKQPRKQRKYSYNAPLHIKQKFVRVHLSTDLKRKYKKRSVGLRKGDKVKILRGQFKKKTGKVDRISVKKTEVYVTGIEAIKKDGTKIALGIHPSNLIITELNLEDKKRAKKLAAAGEAKPEEAKESKDKEKGKEPVKENKK